MKLIHLNSLTESIQLAAAGRSRLPNPGVRLDSSGRDSGHRNRRIERFLRRQDQQLFNQKSEINNLKSAIASSASLRETLLS
jgi:hypothetical protein